MGRLAESLALPASEQRHPALLNAIFLWSCCISRPGPLSQYESHYLSRTLDSLGDALRHPDKAVDVVQASCLLSLYFLSNGRMLEGSYHASAAAALVTQFGLDKGIAQQNHEPLHALKIDTAKDPIEEGDRIMAFWQAYNLDYCWSVVLRKPPVIRDGRYAFASVSPPWPRDAEDYETVRYRLVKYHFRVCLLSSAPQVDCGQPFQATTRPFMESSAANGYSPLALRVKASALFQRADRLSSSWDSRKTRGTCFRFG